MAEESVVDQPQTHVTKIDDEACEKLSIGEGESTRPPSSASSHSSGTPVKDLLKASIGSARPASSASSAHSSASLDAKMLLQELREVANPSLTDLQGDDAQPLWSPPACSSKFMAHLELPVMQADVSSGEADDSDGRPQLNSDSPVCRAWHLASVCVPASASNPSRRPDVAMNQLPIGSLHSQQFRSPRGLPLTPPTRTLSSSSVSPPQVRVPPKPPEVVSGDELQEVSAQKKQHVSRDGRPERTLQAISAPRIPDVLQVTSQSNTADVTNKQGDQVITTLPKAATIRAPNQRRMAKHKPATRVIEE